MKMLSGAVVILAGSIVFSAGIIAEAMKWHNGLIGFLVGGAIIVVGLGSFMEPWLEAVKKLRNKYMGETVLPPMAVPVESEMGTDRRDEQRQDEQINEP